MDITSFALLISMMQVFLVRKVEGQDGTQSRRPVNTGLMYEFNVLECAELDTECQKVVEKEPKYPNGLTCLNTKTCDKDCATLYHDKGAGNNVTSTKLNNMWNYTVDQDGKWFHGGKTENLNLGKKKKEYNSTSIRMQFNKVKGSYPFVGEIKFGKACVRDRGLRAVRVYEQGYEGKWAMLSVKLTDEDEKEVLDLPPEQDSYVKFKPPANLQAIRIYPAYQDNGWKMPDIVCFQVTVCQ